MSVEEEIEMLEKAKEHLETQFKNVNERLEKLKA
jgi:chaperonin cofactor prefoldin